MTDCIHHEIITREGDHFKGTCIKCDRVKHYPPIWETEEKLENRRAWRHKGDREVAHIY